jgi:HEAT repeat protein
MIRDLEGMRNVMRLLTQLKDESPTVRLTAAKALGEIKDTKATDSLIKALSDEEEGVAEAAQEALAKVGKPALDSLKASFEKETDEKIKETLKNIIDKITKE